VSNSSNKIVTVFALGHLFLGVSFFGDDFLESICFCSLALPLLFVSFTLNLILMHSFTLIMLCYSMGG
jgi:hypothetical protein